MVYISFDFVVGENDILCLYHISKQFIKSLNVPKTAQLYYGKSHASLMSTNDDYTLNLILDCFAGKCQTDANFDYDSFEPSRY
jgi:hypothetical protein